MLEVWASTVDLRSEIEQFLDWLGPNGYQGPRFRCDRTSVLNQYFGIDSRQLEKERRALLDAARGEAGSRG